MFDTTSGALIRSFGDDGSSSDSKLHHCFGVRFTPDGNHILIADAAYCQLSMFTLSGDFVRCTIAATPYDVDFAPNGDILVAERRTGNHRVAVYCPDGSTLLRSFTRDQGSEPVVFDSWLDSPRALATRGDELYVLVKARVHVFK